MTFSSNAHNRSEEAKILDWQKHVARSTARRNVSERPSTTRIVVSNINTPTAVASRNEPRRRKETDINAHKFIGTLLGASAGAAVAYAMVRGEHENHPTHETRRAFDRTSVIVGRPPLADIINHQPEYTSTHDMDRPYYSHTVSRPHVQPSLLSARNEHRSTAAAPRRLPLYEEDFAGRTIVQTKNGTKILTGATGSRRSHAASQSRTKELSISAVDVPLPQTKSSTRATRNDAIVPNDSISQVSTRRASDRDRLYREHRHRSGRRDNDPRTHEAYARSSHNRNDRSIDDYTRR